MALILNDDQQMLRESAKTFLSSRAPVGHLRSLRDSGNPEGFSRAIWTEMAGLGWASVLVPEAYGGLEYGHVEIGILLEETGRTLTPSPLLGTALTGVAAIVGFGSAQQKSELLPMIAEGRHVLALACDETSLHEPGRVTTVAENPGCEYCLNGRKVAVLDGIAADTFIVSAQTGESISLFLVPADCEGLKVEPSKLLDIQGAANVKFENVILPQGCLLGSPGNGRKALDYILDTARIGMASELMGIGQEVFERTLDYLKERKQFGVAIGSFQALQHRAAQLYAEIELCKSVVIQSLQALDGHGDNSAELASFAKVKLSEMVNRATAEAIQMHGGIGMTDEFDIGFFIKRYRILETLYGDRYFHLDRYARIRGY